MAEHLNYSGSTPLPGSTVWQDYMVDLALRIVTADNPSRWGALKREMLRALNCGGSEFSDEQMRAALHKVILENAPFYVPTSLFLRLELEVSDMPLMLMSGLAAVSAAGTLAANAYQAQTAKTSASIAATLAADATKL